MAKVGVRGRTRGWVVLALTLVLCGGVVASVAWMRRSDSVDQGRAAYDRGDWETASNLARQRLKIDQDDREAIRLLARASARKGRVQAAMALFDRVGNERLEAEDLYLIGLCLTRKGMVREAEEVWKKALIADANHPETLDAEARRMIETVRPVDAAELAERLARQSGWEVRGDLMLGTLRAELGEPAEAADALRRAFGRDSSLGGDSQTVARANRLLGRTLLQLKKPAEAREALKEAGGPGSAPDPEEIDWLLSRASLQEGNTSEAGAALRRASSYRRTHPLVPEPSPYVGEARCAGCHREIYQDSQKSRHANTLGRPKDLARLPLPEGPRTDPGDPRVVHSIERKGDQIRAETRVGDSTYRMLAEYAFGAESRYLSLVGPDEHGQRRIFRLSYFCEKGGATGWDQTTGQRLRPAAPEEFLGKALDSPHAIYRCLACHTTTPRSVQTGVGPQASDRAIGCERCHGPGGNHIDAVAADFADPAIVSPRLAGAGAVAMCADCHGEHEAASSRPRTDPYWLRFQGTTLPWSRCFTESQGALSCTTCHDPHRDAETSATYYESKCLTCHASGPGKPTSPERVTRTTCPVNPTKDCLGCHMPTTMIPITHHSVTDHYIRIPESRQKTGR